MNIIHASIPALSFDQTISLLGLAMSALQALVLPVTIYLLLVQTRAMRRQTAIFMEQTKEITAQTRVFVDTIYSATFQSLYEAEAHLGELMMTYPEASRILMAPLPMSVEEGTGEMSDETTAVQLASDSALRERVRWLGSAMLDFFEHIWTQAQNRALPKATWAEWEDYMGKMLAGTRLRTLWQAERANYASDFRRFVDLKVGLSPDAPTMPSFPRPVLDRTKGKVDNIKCST